MNDFLDWFEERLLEDVSRLVVTTIACVFNTPFLQQGKSRGEKGFGQIALSKCKN